MRELLSEEIQYMNEFRSCPICEAGKLLQGPSALGLNFNVRCEQCGCELNIAVYGGTVLTGHTLDRDDPSLYRPVNIFPVPGTMEHYEETMRLCQEADQLIAFHRRLTLYIVISLALAAITYYAVHPFR